MFLSTYPSRPHSPIESENKQEKVFNTSPINTHGLTQPKCSSAAVTPSPHLMLVLRTAGTGS